MITSSPAYSYSLAELKLFKRLGFDNEMLDTPPIHLYKDVAIKCFVQNLDGPSVDALRRAVKAINDCTPYRMSPEFDKLIDFEDEKHEFVPKNLYGPDFLMKFNQAAISPADIERWLKGESEFIGAQEEYV